MPFDLRREPWIPWRRRSGRLEWGPPHLLTDGLRDDPVVAVASPRPDFDGALQEFLVGLLTVAFRPADEDEWLDRWHAPPSPDDLAGALAALPAAFDLDGNGPRFFQDLSPEALADAPLWSVESLLIDTAGAEVSEVERRTAVTELFGKPGRYRSFGRPAAAMALLTMQTYAPQGGRGHLTSMRGGGPLTTLVEPRLGEAADREPLWCKLWANVETGERWVRRTTGDRSFGDYSRVFPWLTETRSNEPPRKLVTTPSDAHPLQAYFGMPRRIRLEFGEAGRCDLTGREDEATVRAFRMRAYGVKYSAWRHPLSPYLQDTGREWRALRGRPGGIGWRDWLGLTMPGPSPNREPAQVVVAFIERARLLRLREARVHAFGYATDQNKALAWVESAVPVFAVGDTGTRDALQAAAAALVEATELAASALLAAVKEALFPRGEAIGDLSPVKSELWATTESAFYALMARIARREIPPAETPVALGEFLPVLREAVLRIFDRWAESEGAEPSLLRRIVSGRYGLVMTLGGYTKQGEKLFEALNMPLPGGGAAARKESRRRKKREGAT